MSTKLKKTEKKGKNINMIFCYISLFLSIYFLVKMSIEQIITKIILKRISYKSTINEFLKYTKQQKNN